MILSVYKTDEEEGFKLLYQKYYHSLWLFVDRIIEQPEDARDLVQEFFVDFWVNKKQHKITGDIEKYLFQALKFSSISYLRNKKKREHFQEEIAVSSTSMEKPVNETEINDYEILYATINRLPEERRKIFSMVCVKGMKYHEVASTLNISVGTVKTQMARSIKFLRENLKNYTFSTLLLLLLKKK